MPDVSLTIRSLRRYGDLLMTAWTAIAVSDLFAVVPLGTPGVGDKCAPAQRLSPMTAFRRPAAARCRAWA